MIFGSLPFNGLDECIKLHRMNGSMIWSLVFKPQYDTAEKERCDKKKYHHRFNLLKRINIGNSKRHFLHILHRFHYIAVTVV